MAAAVRAYVNSQIPGGIDKLKVPATDSAIPVPPAPQAYAGRFDTTEAEADALVAALCRCLTAVVSPRAAE